MHHNIFQQVLDEAQKNATLTASMISTLRSKYDNIKTIDPDQPTYKKLTDFLDTLPKHLLKQLAGANIKFVSGLARNRLGMYPSEDVELDEINNDVAKASIKQEIANLDKQLAQMKSGYDANSATEASKKSFDTRKETLVKRKEDLRKRLAESEGDIEEALGTNYARQSGKENIRIELGMLRLKQGKDRHQAAEEWKKIKNKPIEELKQYLNSARAEKLAESESELNELDKKTLQNYHGKAATIVGRFKHTWRRKEMDPKIVAKREKGLTMVKKKLGYETTDEAKDNKAYAIYRGKELIGNLPLDSIKRIHKNDIILIDTANKIVKVKESAKSVKEDLDEGIGQGRAIQAWWGDFEAKVKKISGIDYKSIDKTKAQKLKADGLSPDQAAAKYVKLVKEDLDEGIGQGRAIQAWKANFEAKVKKLAGIDHKKIDWSFANKFRSDGLSPEEASEKYVKMIKESKDTTYSSHGWNTRKVGDSYEWSVTGVNYNQPMTVLEKGTKPTRAAAIGAAKKAAMKYRNKTKNESVIIDEISTDTKASYEKKAKEQVKELTPWTKKGEYKDIAKRMIARRKKGLDTLNRTKNESEDLIESTENELIRKALGKMPDGKERQDITTAIADNGDFVVHNRGAVIGRLKKGTFQLSEDLDENIGKNGKWVEYGSHVSVGSAKGFAKSKGLIKEGESLEIDERTLTKFEQDKKEEIANAIKKDDPTMNKSKKIAIATAQAKKIYDKMVAKNADESTVVIEKEDREEHDNKASLLKKFHAAARKRREEKKRMEMKGPDEEVELGESADKHQLKILKDTLRNPSKGKFLGGPSAEEAEETLRIKYGFTDKQIKALKESVELDEGKISPFDAKDILAANGGVDANFFELRTSQIDGLLTAAKKYGYKKSAYAPGSTGRMFHQYLKRLVKKINEDTEYEIEDINEKKQYTTKAGLKQWKQSFKTLEKAAREGTVGYCLACGAKNTGVEPDARKYTCKKCGKDKVYGAEELILMGLGY